MANLATINNNLLADSGIDPVDLIVGTGTVNYVPKFSAEGTIANSQIFDDGTNVGINTITPQGKLESKTAAVFAGDATYAKKAFVANIPYSTTNITSSALAIYDGSSIHAANIGYAYDGAGYYMAFAVNSTTSGTPTEAIRITRSRQVGINTQTLDNSQFVVYTAAGSVFRVAYNGANRVEIGNYTTADGYRLLDISSSQITFSSGTAGNASLTERGKFTPGGWFKASNTGVYKDTESRHEFISNSADNNIYLGNSHPSTPYGPWINFSAASPNNRTSYFLVAQDTTTARFTLWSDGGATFGGRIDGTSATLSGVLTVNDRIQGNNSNALILSSNSAAGEISFWANQGATRRMTLSGAGLLYINTTTERSTGYSTSSAGHYISELLNYGGAQYFTNVNTAEGSYLVLGKSRGTAANSVTAVQNNDILGGLIFQGTDGTSTLVGTGIISEVDGTVSTGNIPSRLTFSTSSGSGSLVQRMRISSSGAIRFNAYGSGTNTGTVTYNLAVDASGNVIETAGGVVDGSGTANYVPRWQDANTLTNSIIYDSGTNIGINTASPSHPLTVQANTGANAIALYGRSSDNTSSLDFFQNNGTTRLFEFGVSPSAVEFYYDANSPMLFYTNGTERTRITAGGLVGINTNAPVNLLHVLGGASTPSTSANNGVATIGTSNGIQLSIGAANASPYGVFLQTKDANNAGPYNYPILLNPVNGAVAIGTTDPGGYKLKVVNSGAAGISIVTTGSTSANPSIQMLTGAIDTTVSATADGLELTAYSAHSVIFRSTALERMRLTPGGNLYLGTTADVSGAGKFVMYYGSDSNYGIVINNTYTTTANNSYFFRYYQASTELASMFAANNSSAIFNIVGRFGINFNTDGAPVGTTRMVIIPNGNVGINTTDPQDKLEIKSGYLRMYDPSNTANAGYLIQWSSNNGGTNLTYAGIDGITTDTGVRTGALRFLTSNNGAPSEKARLTATGRLGINKTNPIVMLDVRGTSTGTLSSVTWFSDNSVNQNGLAVRAGTGRVDLLASWEGTAINTDITFTPTNSVGNQIETMRVLSNNSVAIGTSTSGNSKFVVYTGTGSSFRVANVGANRVEIGNYSAADGYQETDITSSFIRFITGTAGGGSATERGRFTEVGWFQASNTATYSANNMHQLVSNSADNIVRFGNSHPTTPYGPWVHFSATAPNNRSSYFLIFEDNVSAKTTFWSDGGATFSGRIDGTSAVYTGNVTVNGGIIGNNSNNLYLSSNSAAGEISFWANALSTRLFTITGAGLLLSNTTSSRSTGYTTNPKGHYAAELLNYGGAQYFTNVNNAEGTYLVLGKSRGTTVNSVTAVQNNDVLGALVFQGTEGTDSRVGAGIFALVDGTVSTGNIPSRLMFYTSAGIGSLSERMRLTSGGNLLLGTTSDVTRLTINGGAASTSTNYQFKNISVTSGFTSGYTGTAIVSLLAGYDGSGIYGTDIGYGYDGSGYTLMFSTNDDTTGNPIERMRIGSNGRVGIGVTNPDYKLHVSSTDAVLKLSSSSASFSSPSINMLQGAIDTVLTASNNGLEIGTWSNHPIIFKRNTSEAMRIDTSSRLLVNSTTATTTGGFTNTTVGIKQLTDGGSGGGLHIEQNSNTNVAFFGFTGSVFQIGTSYRSTGSYQPIAFNTQGQNRLIINNDGEILINYTTDQGGYMLQVNGSTYSSSGFFESSDIRLKTILNRHQSIDFDAIEYNWNDGRDSKLHWGYAAQEVMKVLPDAVNGTEELFYTLDYNQVHTYKIAMLEKRIAELESQLKNK
jgi:hypothetical protein